MEIPTYTLKQEKMEKVSTFIINFFDQAVYIYLCYVNKIFSYNGKTTVNYFKIDGRDGDSAISSPGL